MWYFYDYKYDRMYNRGILLASLDNSFKFEGNCLYRFVYQNNNLSTVVRTQKRRCNKMDVTNKNNKDNQNVQLISHATTIAANKVKITSIIAISNMR